MGELPPPLPPSVKTRNSFYHHAATCCLLAPFICFGFNLILTIGKVNNAPRTRLESLVEALFSGLILLSGVFFGVVSLFGIKKYGRTGILWKAVTGILIFAFLVLAAIPAVLKAREMARERYEQLYGHPPP